MGRVGKEIRRRPCCPRRSLIPCATPERSSPTSIKSFTGEASTSTPKTITPKGKLRLLYECAPLALIAEQAGGGATTGKVRVSDIQPESVHQRIPFAIGSRYEIERYEEAYRGALPGTSKALAEPAHVGHKGRFQRFILSMPSLQYFSASST